MLKPFRRVAPAAVHLIQEGGCTVVPQPPLAFWCAVAPPLIAVVSWALAREAPGMEQARHALSLGVAAQLAAAALSAAAIRRSRSALQRALAVAGVAGALLGVAWLAWMMA